MPADGTPRQHVAASLARERENAGMSQAELARRAGVAKSTLSQLESGSGNPSLETLWSLSTALDIPFSRLVDPTHRGVAVIRAEQQAGISSEDGRYSATLLSAAPAHARRDIYAVHAEPGSVRQSAPHRPGSIEHVVMGVGRARVGPVGAAVELKTGDYMNFPGDEEHIFEALEPSTSASVIVENA